ncbi:MAG: MarR family transcriptional regulator [Devosiaceae bacterium]|nr:MarR family transcriptional regulator [Devosiaceae bacterium]
MSKEKKLPPYLNSLGRFLGFASGASSALTQSHLDKYELTLQYWVILTALWRVNGLTITQLAQYYRVQSPAASRLISRMERDGWVKREHSSRDKRESFIFLSDKAKQHEHLLSLYEVINEQLTDGFSQEEIEQLKNLLTRIGNNAKKHST